MLFFFKSTSLPVGAFLLSSGKSLHRSTGLPACRFFGREISFFSASYQELLIINCES